MEAVADADESLMEKYLEGGQISESEIRAAIRKGTLAMTIVPVLCGSAFKNRGVQPLLDAVVEYLPSPLDVPAVRGILSDSKDKQEATREASDAAPFAALAFKIMSDPFVGTLTFFRVYSGVLASGSYVFNSTKGGRKERIGRLLKMHANKREDIKEVYAGDIAAAVGLRQTTTGDTLCDEDHPIILESIEFPDPVIHIAIEPKTKDDQERLGVALQKLATEDPSFRVHTDKETGQTIISGMGELHLEIIVDRLLREFKVDANVGKPQVAYRETIRKSVEQEGKFIRQTGGRGQYGHVWITLEPLPPGGGFEFVDGTKGGTVPREYIAPVEKGVREAFEGGVLAGYPLVDVKVHPHRRLLPRRRLLRDRLQDRRLDGGEGGRRESQADHPRADHGGRGGGSRGVHGRGDRRLEQPARTGPGMRAARRSADHHRAGAARPDVRLRDRLALQDPGARDLHHAVRALRAGATDDLGRDRGQGRGRLRADRRSV